MKLQKEIKAVLFDLDGTLLPMNQNDFIKQYFKRLAEYGVSLGLDPKALIEGTMAGTAAMLKNDGSTTNREAFWKMYFEFMGEKRADLEALLDKFYIDEFNELKAFVAENPLAKRVVQAAHSKGRQVVLATNPVFPMQAQLNRIKWLSLGEGDFHHITSYDNSSYCKPSPKYYFEICKKIGVVPENCLMIGNDEGDDMMGASMAGMSCFLVTDCLIEAKDFQWTGDRGSLEDVMYMLETL